MPLTIGLTDSEAEAIADRVLRQALGEGGFEHAAVHAGLDHDGDPALFVTAFLKADSPAISAALYDATYGTLDDAFRAEGERRFSYFRISRPGETVDDGPDEADRV